MCRHFSQVNKFAVGRSGPAANSDSCQLNTQKCESEGGKIIPTAAQLLKCFVVCYELTNMYQPIYIVRLDERTNYLYILAGETIEIEIYPNGQWRYCDEQA
ncbi:MULTISPECIES: DUF6888 family protein [unclassified Microcoleus]|uniref:DUF6888 family protein n=1 Tax=unclassified Microcoleus TaxID=2642155 RepID=UPI004040A7FE